MTNKFRVWGGRERLYFVYSDLFEGTNDEWFTDLTIQPDGSRHIIEKSDVIMIQWFTGIHDIHGKEIYEGDICKGFGFYNEPNEFHKDHQIGVVKYGPGWFFRCENLSKKCRGGEMNISWKLEVIGNIYENPELISESGKE